MDGVEPPQQHVAGGVLLTPHLASAGRNETWVCCTQLAKARGPLTWLFPARARMHGGATVCHTLSTLPDNLSNAGWYHTVSRQR